MGLKLQNGINGSLILSHRFVPNKKNGQWQ